MGKAFKELCIVLLKIFTIEKDCTGGGVTNAIVRFPLHLEYDYKANEL